MRAETVKSITEAVVTIEHDGTEWVAWLATPLPYAPSWHTQIATGCTLVSAAIAAEIELRKRIKR